MTLTLTVTPLITLSIAIRATAILDQAIYYGCPYHGYVYDGDAYYGYPCTLHVALPIGVYTRTHLGPPCHGYTRYGSGIGQRMLVGSGL